jgi:hypothetical protein
MRLILIAMLGAAAVGLIGTSGSLAAPAVGTPIIDAADSLSPVQDVRRFCYNRYTGRFIHWGPCRRSTVPRVYCRNRYTGRFLHWGSCRR